MSLSNLMAAVSVLVLVSPFAAMAQSADVAAAPAAVATTPAVNLAPNGDLVATLKANPSFSILVKALAAANLEGVLASTPDITLFAPTDAAFQALPPATLAVLMKTDNAPILQKILTYHLIHLNLDSSKIKGAKGPVVTVEGQPVQIDGSGALATVNNAAITQMDVKASNGYIQVIDKVLMPSDVTVPAS